MEDNNKNHKKIFMALAALIIMLCCLLVYLAYSTTKNSAATPTKHEQATTKNSNSIATEYEPKDPATRAKIDKLLKDFLPAWVEINSQMSPDDYRNRIKPFITTKLYQQLSGGELPPADKITLKNFRITQTEDYSYTIYYNEEELQDKWEELSQHIYVVVDKNSCLIDGVSYN